MTQDFFLFQGQAITPLDGRNFQKIKNLSQYFSEFALTKYRIFIETEYLKVLLKNKITRNFTGQENKIISLLSDKFDEKSFVEVKKIEEEIVHDVKAVEYYIRSKLEKTSLKDVTSFIHFGMTSEDTNNLAYALILKDFKEKIAEAELLQLINQLAQMAKKYADIPLLARTHGQPAVGTTVGKELANYVYRLRKQLLKLRKFRFEGKCNGAVGNNNALKTVLPEKNWLKITSDFVFGLGLDPNPYTSQILYYDNFLEFFQIISLVNGILHDLCVNLWIYVMLEVFVQIKKEKEVGSSTMPQKVNPINFENAEGNLQLANGMMEFFERKLTHSRLQRDLSDSTIRRNFGEAMGYSILAWKNLMIGLEKLSVNENRLKAEIENRWEILTEAIQTTLRLKNDKKAYEKMKTLVRGKTINQDEYKKILIDLGLDRNKNLSDLTPSKYIGYATELTKQLNLKT